MPSHSVRWMAAEEKSNGYPRSISIAEAIGESFPPSRRPYESQIARRQ
jgi:hypothetical protein